VTPLSPRERTVLELTGAGLSTKEVARRLGISPNTVKFHLQAAFDKLGVASRAEAVMVAIRCGELSV
jgi:DNA-binding CsgD family transcriptional regulator